MSRAQKYRVQCRCGRLTFDAEGPPILAVTCYCDCCQAASHLLAGRSGEALCDEDGGTPFVMHRKDRIDFSHAAEQLLEHRLTPSSPTRRVLAKCCSSALFLEFQHGHWVSLYASRIPQAQRPPPALRSMTKFAPRTDVAGGRAKFDDGLPSPATHNVSFMARLLWAWICMGFRSPNIPVGGKLEAVD